VGEDDAGYMEVVRGVEHPVRFVARVDDERPAAGRVGQDVAAGT
jgi:hypothetical protein